MICSCILLLHAYQVTKVPNWADHEKPNATDPAGGKCSLFVHANCEVWKFKMGSGAGASCVRPPPQSPQPKLSSFCRGGARETAQESLRPLCPCLESCFSEVRASRWAIRGHSGTCRLAVTGPLLFFTFYSFLRGPNSPDFAFMSFALLSKQAGPCLHQTPPPFVGCLSVICLWCTAGKYLLCGLRHYLTPVCWGSHFSASNIVLGPPTPWNGQVTRTQLSVHCCPLCTPSLAWASMQVRDVQAAKPTCSLYKADPCWQVYQPCPAHQWAPGGEERGQIPCLLFMNLCKC